MKSILLFDIDHTLIDNNKLHTIFAQKLLFSILSPLEFVKNISSLVYYLSLNQTDTPKLGKIKGSLYSKDTFNRSLFADVITTMISVQKKVDIGVFSEGVYKMQYLKIRLSDVDHFVDNELFFTFPQKTRNINKIRSVVGKRKIIFVDNRFDICNELAKLGYTAFQIARGTAYQKEFIHKNIVQIKDLSQINTTYQYLLDS